MAAEIRVDKIKSRSGINTIDLSLSNDGFVFNDNVGIGTSSVLGAANAANTRVLNVGVVTANNVYAAFTGDITGDVTGDATGLSGSPTITVTAVNVGTAATLSANGNVAFAGLATANGGVQVGTSATIFANGNAAFAGVATANGGFNIGIQSAGIVVAQNVGISTLNFVGSGNSITYHSSSNTLGIEISGGSGGVSETSTDVSSTSATGVGSFAIADYRSAAIIAQVDQSGTYQVGRYLMIHDGTTVTVVEESSVSTGDSQIASYSGTIVGTNAEFQVTMGSSGIATVTTKLDTVTAYS
tara:strand:- start:375 stop:1271 length:897 start_codon:yes stop_codon:yes gene_type:complete